MVDNEEGDVSLYCFVSVASAGRTSSVRLRKQNSWLRKQKLSFSWWMTN